MNRVKNIICFLVFSYSSMAQTHNLWTQVADYPGIAKVGFAMFSIDSFGYVGLGLLPGHFGFQDTFPTDFWQYNPYTNQWLQRANFPGVGRTDLISIVMGSKAYVGLGYYNGSFKDFWEYDPASDTWTQKTDFPGGPRSDALAFASGNVGYVGMGSSDSASNKKDVWRYDPTSNTWTQINDFPGGNAYEQYLFSINGLVYTGFGKDQYGINDFWSYDPTLDSWQQLPYLTDTSIYGYSFAYTIGNKGYIDVLYDSSGFVNTTYYWEFDPANGSWIQKDSFPGGPRYGPASFSIANRGFAGSGDFIYNVTTGPWVYYNDFWMYTPDSIATGIKNIDASSISIYPDPATDRLSITNLPHDAIITISDMTGRFCNASIAANQIDVSALPAGVYFIQVQNTDRMITKKFVKQ